MENKDCIFCKIARGEIPAEKVWEDEDYLVMLDAFPVIEGQVLLIPKKHNPYLFDVDDKEYSDLLLKAKKVVNAVDKALKPKRTAMVVEGLEVSHVHIKFYPLQDAGICSLKPLNPKPSDSEMKEIAEKIKRFL